MSRPLPALVLLIALVLASLWLVAPAQAIDLDIGDWVELKATNPRGVPLHRDPRPSLMGRAPDGARAEVLATDAEQHWLQIRLEDERVGWIIENYVGRVVPSPTPEPSGNDEWLVWGSPDGCRQVVTAGRRMAAQQTGTLRMGSWNIRWFPDETDLDWLACTIAWMNVDVLGVIEIRDTDEARTAMATVRDTLHTLTGVSWEVDLHDCGPRPAQHVGFLWNTARVTVTARETSPPQPSSFRPTPRRPAWCSSSATAPTLSWQRIARNAKER